MPKYTMEMVLEYARVFPENADMGDADSKLKLLRDIANKGGQYVVNLYFTSEEQIKQLLAEGMDPKPMGNDRVLNGNEFGIGKYIKAKRDVQDKLYTFTQKNGTEVEVNYGGAPGIVDLTQGAENKRWWSYDEDGPLGNGTKALVQFETYSNGAGIRIVNIGVTEHVPYEQNDNPNSEYNELFKVA
jgi:hypothetical protein